MARGNQRDKAREANLKKQAAMVGLYRDTLSSLYRGCSDATLQKKGNSLSGTELQRAKETAAEKMREKQRLGMISHPHDQTFQRQPSLTIAHSR